MSVVLPDDIAEVAKVDIRPGDVLAVRFAGRRLDQQTAESVKERVSAAFPFDVNVLVFDADTELEVIRQEATS